MARAWALEGEPEAAQIVPAELREGGLPGLLGDPGRDFGAGPQSAIEGGSVQQGSKGLLLERGEAGSFAWIGGTVVSKSVGSVLIVAVDEVTEPVSAEADDGSGVFGRAAGGNQPHGVPAARRGGVGRGFVGREEFVCSEMWVQG